MVMAAQEPLARGELCRNTCMTGGAAPAATIKEPYDLLAPALAWVLKLVTMSATRPERLSTSAGLLAARAEETAAAVEERSAPTRTPACSRGRHGCFEGLAEQSE